MQAPGDVGVDAELRLERSLSDESAEGIEAMMVGLGRWRSSRNKYKWKFGCDTTAMRSDAIVRCDAIR